MAGIQYPVEVRRIIERVRLNMPSPEAIIRECRRKIYALDNSGIDIHSPSFEQYMRSYKEARKALLDLIKLSKQEIRERENPQPKGDGE